MSTQPDTTRQAFEVWLDLPNLRNPILKNRDVISTMDMLLVYAGWQAATEHAATHYQDVSQHQVCGSVSKPAYNIDAAVARFMDSWSGSFTAQEIEAAARREITAAATRL